MVAVVETASTDRDNKFSPPDEDSKKIAGHIMDFFEHEVRTSRVRVIRCPKITEHVLTQQSL